MKAELLCFTGFGKIRGTIWTSSAKDEQDASMSDFRSYAPDLDTQKSEIELSPFESHHLVGTNRARSGDEVVLFNGAGLEWRARLVEADRRKSCLKRLDSIHHEATELSITLAIGIIKGKTFDTILRQATELGVKTIQPLLTRWTQVQIKDADSKKAKWEQQLIEACKQSGNPWLPKLNEPRSMDDYVKQSHFDTVVVASLENRARTWSELSLTQSTTLFIGPEGDFTPEEYEQLSSLGAQAVTLGSQVLRSETAVVSALSVLMESISRQS